MANYIQNLNKKYDHDKISYNLKVEVKHVVVDFNKTPFLSNMANGAGSDTQDFCVQLFW